MKLLGFKYYNRRYDNIIHNFIYDYVEDSYDLFYDINNTNWVFAVQFVNNLRNYNIKILI